MIKEIAFSSYPVSDLPRARAFYEGVLGLEVGPAFPPTAESSWIEYDIGGRTFAIDAQPVQKPSAEGALVAFEVDDFEKMVEKLKNEKIVFTLEPMESPVCRFAVIRDPDNNAIMIHKRKPGNV